jgi:putative transposase
MFDSKPEYRFRTYQFQLRPNSRQLRDLEKAGAARRFAYNWALETWRQYFAETGRAPSRAYLCRELTKKKRQPGSEWLGEISCQVPQQAVADLWQAYQAFFRGRARYPRFKSRKRGAPRFRFPGPTKVRGDRIHLPRIGWIRMRLSRTIEGELRSVTVRKGAGGTWFALILTRFELNGSVGEVHESSRFVGIDLGLVRIGTLSDGRVISRARFAARADRRLRVASRRLTRMQEGSRNWHRARRRLGLLHARTAAQRKDFLHKTTTSMVQRYVGFAIDAVDARGLARTKLSASVMDASLGEFRRQLAYKADWARKPLMVVGRFYPSTKLCSKCRRVNPGIGRSERKWTCSCGAIHDRDLNAAKNIRREGLRLLVAAGHADTENACGVHVRPAMRATDEEAGIPKRECQTGSISVSPRPGAPHAYVR